MNRTFMALAVGAIAFVGFVVVSNTSTWNNFSNPAEDTIVGTPPALELVTRTVSLEDGSEITFRLPVPFEIAEAAEGLGKARFMAMSPDGRLFVPDIVDYNLSHQGKVYVLEDFNEETKSFETKHAYLSGLRGP